MRFLGKRIGYRLAVLSAAAGMVLAVSQRGLASATAEQRVLGYDVTAPVTGHELTVGTTTEITWLGGEPEIPVNIYLIDVDQWAVVEVIAQGITDDGQEYWYIPSNLPAGDYQIYIEDVDQTGWTYGSPFTIS